MTDEIDTFDSGGRVSKFQGGELIWRKATNKVSEVKSTDLIIDLPFAANEPWEIIQANAASTSDSHGGPWAYCWDFILAGKAQSQSNGHTFVSVADGQILYAEQTFPAGPGNPPTSGNVVIQRLGVGRYASYLHIKTGSYTKHFGSGSMFLPQAMPGSGPIAKSGVVLAEVGDSGAGAGAYHLHFCVTTKPDRPQFKPFESVPVAFRNYSVSTDGGNKWTFVTAGVPRNAQWVRRENKGGPTGPQVNANASVLNVGTVSGQITSLNGKAGASGGTMSVSIISEWGESVASKTINIPANSAGPWPYSIGNVPAFNDLKAAALYKGSWTVPADLIAGEGGSFALAPNGTAASNIQLKATAIK
jgi:hypothetical protein